MEGSESIFENSCPPLLSLCIKPMKAFALIRTHLKPVPLTLSSLVNECFALHRALVKVQRFDLHSLDVLEKVRREQVLDSLEAFFLGCDMTMAAVNERAEEFRRHALVLSASNGARPPTGSNPILQHFWKEDEMKEIVVQIREYRSGLTDLLIEVQSYDFLVEDIGLEADLLHQGTLIHRENCPERMMRLSWSRTLAVHRIPPSCDRARSVPQIKDPYLTLLLHTLSRCMSIS
jgi:hypothetical protein